MTVQTICSGASPRARHGCAAAGPVGVGEVEPVDHHQADPVEQPDERQQQRVGVRREPAHRQVRGAVQDGEPPP